MMKTIILFGLMTILMVSCKKDEHVKPSSTNTYQTYQPNKVVNTPQYYTIKLDVYGSILDITLNNVDKPDTEREFIVKKGDVLYVSGICLYSTTGAANKTTTLKLSVDGVTVATSDCTLNYVCK